MIWEGIGRNSSSLLHQVLAGSAWLGLEGADGFTHMCGFSAKASRTVRGWLDQSLQQGFFTWWLKAPEEVKQKLSGPLSTRSRTGTIVISVTFCWSKKVHIMGRRNRLHLLMGGVAYRGGKNTWQLFLQTIVFLPPHNFDLHIILVCCCLNSTHVFLSPTTLLPTSRLVLCF